MRKILGNLPLAIGLLLTAAVGAHQPALADVCASRNSQTQAAATTTLTPVAYMQTTGTTKRSVKSLKLRYSLSGLIHKSVLTMNGNRGIMQTTFFNVDTNQTERIEQTMCLRLSERGVELLGYEPVYAGTRNPHPTYSPDNFLFQLDADGSKVVSVCDDSRQCGAVDIVGTE